MLTACSARSPWGTGWRGRAASQASRASAASAAVTARWTVAGLVVPGSRSPSGRRWSVVGGQVLGPGERGQSGYAQRGADGAARPGQRAGEPAGDHTVHPAPVGLDGHVVAGEGQDLLGVRGAVRQVPLDDPQVLDQVAGIGRRLLPVQPERRSAARSRPAPPPGSRPRRPRADPRRAHPRAAEWRTVVRVGGARFPAAPASGAWSRPGPPAVRRPCATRAQVGRVRAAGQDGGSGRRVRQAGQRRRVSRPSAGGTRPAVAPSGRRPARWRSPSGARTGRAGHRSGRRGTGRWAR